MGNLFQAPTLYALLVFSIIPLSAAMNCEYFEHSAANASFSITIPGFQPFINATGLKNNTWIISTALSQKKNIECDSYVMDQRFYLSDYVSRRPNKLLPSELPYTGCAILLKGFASTQLSTGTQNATDSCKGVLDSACTNAILSTINMQILQGALNNDDVCKTILTDSPAECEKNPWTAKATTQPFGNPSYSASINESCPSSIFNGTSDLIKTMSEVTSPISDTSTYDKWVLQSTPLVLVAFAKNRTWTTPGWSTSAMVCLTPETIGYKSRSPSSGPKQQVAPTVWKIGLWAGVISAVVKLLQ